MNKQTAQKAFSDMLQEKRANGSIDENLDYDTLRENLSAAFRSYLELMGESADNRLIDYCVDVYFRDRCRFIKPAMNLPVKALAMVYLHRKYLLILPALLVLIAAFGLFNRQSSSGSLETVSIQWSSFKTRNNADCEGLHYAQAFCDKYLQQINSAIAEGDAQLRDFNGKKLDILESNLVRHRGTVLAATNKINEIKELDAYYNQLIHTSEFTRNRRKFEQLGRAADDVASALANQTDPAWALDNLKTVQTLVNTANSQERLARNYLNQLSRLRLPAEDMAMVRTYADTALAGAARLETQSAEKNIDELSYLLSLAGLDLELRLVKTDNIAQVVTRDEGLRILAYLIVDARDKSGAPVNLRVSDVRTGVTELVSQFGIRVPPEVYETAQSGELRDLVADKPKGRLSFRYRIQTLNDTITEWQDGSFYGQ